MAGLIEIRDLTPSDCSALGNVFARLDADPSATRFHPHPFTSEQAEVICQRKGIRLDVYFGAFDGAELLGYGMLRGFDEGYPTPAFGVAVDAGARGRGIGGALLDWALDRARSMGASSVMLKVYPDNTRARSLYESRGFAFDETTPDGRQLIGRLSL